MKPPIRQGQSIAMIVMALAAALAGSGCTDPVQAPVRILPVEPDADPLSTKIALIADGQVHNLYSDPYVIHTSIVDAFVEVAIRPPALDLWALDIFRETVALVRQPIVYLGDATDIACTGEFEAFVTIINKAEKPWLFAPGNHDAFFVGNAHLATGDDTGGQWEKACRHAGAPLTKDLLVKVYLAALTGQPNPDLSIEAFAATSPGSRRSGQWQAPAHANGILGRIAWHVDKKAWASFVVQMLTLQHEASEGPPVYLILFDTADYDEMPIAAGAHGNISQRQADTVQTWLAEAATERIVVFAGHHPYDSLETDTKKRLDELRRQSGNPVYISAHTHRGGFEVHEDDDGDRPPWVELNVGSITDWPQHYRTFALHRLSRADGTWSVLMETPLVEMNEKAWFQGRGDVRPERCDPTWEPATKDADYALAYQKKATLPSASRDRILSAVLHAYRRMLVVHPSTGASKAAWPASCSDDACLIAAIDKLTAGQDKAKRQLAFIQQLESFERARFVEDDLGRREFRVCQALWASKREQLRVINPVISDQWIQLSEAR